MDLLPIELLELLESQHGRKEGKQHDELVLTRFFTPDANWSWYPVSAKRDPESDDVEFFGIAETLNIELRCFWLSELNQVFPTLGIPVERDSSWAPIPLFRLLEDLEEVSCFTLTPAGSRKAHRLPGPQAAWKGDHNAAND